MIEFSAATRRLLELSRDVDEPPPSAERVVRDRLIAELGVAALAGAASMAAAGVAESAGAASVATASAVGAATAADTVGVAGAGALASGASSTGVAATAAASAATAAGTTVLAKTVAGLILATGLGTAAMQSDAVPERVREWPVEVAAHTKDTAERIWRFIAGSGEQSAPSAAHGNAVEPSLGFDERRHRLLMGIARRPDRPVAKEAELFLILGAEDALSSGDTSLATSYLDRHQKRFADGVLSDSREALRVLVHCARGDGERAQNGAREFLRKFPTSEQADRLRACKSAEPIGGGASPAPAPSVPAQSDKPNF